MFRVDIYLRLIRSAHYNPVNAAQTSHFHSKLYELMKIFNLLIVNNIWEWLTEPSEKINSEEQRRRAKLLSALLLPVLLLYLAASQVALDSEKMFFLYMFFIMLGIYAVSRTRYYMIAGILAVFIIISLMFGLIFAMDDLSRTSISNEFKWLSIPLVFASLCLPLRVVLPIVVVVISAFFATPFIKPIPFEYIIEPMTNVSIISILALITTRVFTSQQKKIEQERKKSERLLLNILPGAIAEKLKESNEQIADKFDEVTILFADIVGFTALSARIDASELVDFLNTIFSKFDEISDKYGLEKIKTIGDAYMVAGGVPTPGPGYCEAAANMALEMIDAMKDIIRNIPNEQYSSLDIRIGIHFGNVVAGIIGKNKFSYDVWGDTVNMASRMESLSLPGKIQVSEEVYKKLHASYKFENRGDIDIKGKGKKPTYFLKSKVAGTAR